MTPTTPSPISDQAAGEPIDMALLAGYMVAFEKWWPEWRHLCPDRGAACVAFVAGMDALSIATTPESVYAGWKLVPLELTEEMRKAANEHDQSMFQPTWASTYRAMLAAAPTAPTTGSAPCVCGMPSDALSVHRQDGPCYRKEVPASPAASMLSEDAILAIAVDHGLGTAVVESIVKDLLAASMGGDKS